MNYYFQSFVDFETKLGNILLFVKSFHAPTDEKWGYVYLCLICGFGVITKSYQKYQLRLVIGYLLILC